MRNKISNLIWGLIFIVIGVGIAGDIMNLWNFRIFFPGWWTLFIIIPCLLSIVRGGVSAGALTGLIIGIMLLSSQYFSFDFNLWRLILPAVLIILGIKIAFQGAFRKTIPIDNTVHVEGHETYKNSNRQEYSAVFASNNTRVIDHFTGTNLNAVFGSISLDLRDAIINSDIEISATAVFGGIDIYLPSNVKIKVNNIPIFGGISNKTVKTSDPNAYTIYLNSTTMFGGIDIK